MLFSAASLAVFGLATLGQAHVLMGEPKPFAGTISSPLDPNGDNFPCQAVAYTGGGSSMPLGSQQALSFIGSAVHGGGSCQVSITYDKSPNKNSVWKVIHTIHGGCPMKNIAGNNGNDASKPSPDKYPFTIPTDIPTGEAILAWSWFNKIGNREMYMNCAPISITGSNTRRGEDILEARNATQLMERDIAAYNALPDMFTANMGNGCGTKEGQAVEFPNPGSSIETNESNLIDPVELTQEGGKCQKKGAGSSSPAPAPAEPVASQAPSPTKTSLPGGVFFEPSAAPPQATSTTAPVTTAPAANPPAQSPAPIQATTLTVVPTKPSAIAPPAGTGTSGALSGPCSTEGEWNCIGGTSFQQCGSGSWSAPQQLAAGTKCTPGQSSAIDIQAIGAKKRDLRFSGAHLRRHLHKAS